MTDESIADQLLRRKNELIEGWDRWVNRSPNRGEQCAVVDGIGFVGRIGPQARLFFDEVIGRSMMYLNDNSGPDYRTVVLDALDRCIAEAKDRGI